MRALIVSIATLLSGCPGVTPGPAPTAHISRTVILSLPVPPRYPETTTILHAVHGRYGDRDVAIEAALALSPERVNIVITAAGGPRLATIRWDRKGLHHDRTLWAPVGIPVENIVADIFLATWPVEQVAKALPSGCELLAPDATRKITCEGKAIVEIAPSPSGATIVRNLAFGYELTIVSRVLD
jgi:hypothetical protein